MSYHRFAELTQQGENGISSPEFAALLAPDLTFDSPYLLQPLHDKALTIRFLKEMFAQTTHPKYTHQYTDDQNATLLLWEGEVTGPDGRTFSLEGSIAITEGDDGLIHHVTAYLRPLQVGALTIKAMVSSAATVLPKEYWEATRK